MALYFDYRAYANVYPDLKAACGCDAQKFYAHYVNFGRAEGRVGIFTSGPNPKSGTPVYGSFRDRFRHGKETKMKIKRMIAAMMSAFVMAGCVMSVSAAEDASTFDYRAYANIYPDVKAAYGYDAAKLYAHYVNYGQAEGRVGSFLASPNPKNAPIYGVSTGFTNQTLPAELFGQAIVPATLLDPIPPTKPSQMNNWRLTQLTTVESMSNAKLVAECISVCGYMDLARAAWKAGDANDPAHAWNIEPTEMWEDKLYQEFNDRLNAVKGASDPDGWYYESSIKSPAYKRAIMSDTRILEQHANRYADFPAPPADPFTPPAAPVTP